MPSCDFTLASHDACGDNCPIVLDQEIRCGEALAQGGVRVAPGSTHTYVAAATNDGSYMFELTPTDGTTLSDFPLQVQGGMLELALDGTGALHVAADDSHVDGSTSPVGYPGGLAYVRASGSDFVKESVYDSDERFTPPYDFDLAPDGTAYIWFATYDEVGTNGDALATRAPGGGWSIGDAKPVGIYQHFSLDADGQPVSFGFVEAASGYMLAYGPNYTQLGNPLDGFSPGRFRVTHGPAPSVPAGSAPFVAAIHAAEGLHLAWPDAQSFVDLSLTGTGVPAYVCPPSYDSDPSDPTCPADCHETASGLEYDAFAIARTADGLVWVAYVVTHFDQVIGYEQQCAEGYCWCSGSPKSDASTAELSIVRFTPGLDQPTLALNMPIPRLAGRTFLDGMWEDNRIVDIRGFGSSLGVALRVEDATGPYLRVLRLEPLVGAN